MEYSLLSFFGTHTSLFFFSRFNSCFSTYILSICLCHKARKRICYILLIVAIQRFILYYIILYYIILYYIILYYIIHGCGSGGRAPHPFSRRASVASFPSIPPFLPWDRVYGCRKSMRPPFPGLSGSQIPRISWFRRPLLYPREIAHPAPSWKPSESAISRGSPGRLRWAILAASRRGISGSFFGRFPPFLSLRIRHFGHSLLYPREMAILDRFWTQDLAHPAIKTP